MKRTFLALILAIIITGVFIGLIVATSDANEPTTVYGWETNDGTMSFTDNVNAVPEMYVDVATARTGSLGGLKNFEKLTIELESTYADDLTGRLAHLREMNAVGVQRRIRLRDCSGHVLVTSQRIQDGDFNRRIYVATDACGRTATVTPFNPSVQINR